MINVKVEERRYAHTKITNERIIVVKESSNQVCLIVLLMLDFLVNYNHVFYDGMC